jgi:hypothetical protein
MSTAKFETLSNVAGTQTVPVATVAQGSAKAWVNFDGTGTVAIRAAFNVSSITDNGTGNYTVNFTNAMPDANYSGVASCGLGNATNFGTISLGTFSTTQFNFGTGYISGGNFPQDNNFVTVAVFR